MYLDFLCMHTAQVNALAANWNAPVWTATNGGIEGTLSNGAYCQPISGARTAIFNFVCDATTNGAIMKIVEAPSCTYTLDFHTKLVCANSGGSGGSGSGGESSGLSGGSIFDIVFFVLLFVYFVGGVSYYKFVVGTESWVESIPNSAFWTDLPYLIADGCIFFWKTALSCCKKKDYETL